jgi:hypothetical protein
VISVDGHLQNTFLSVCNVPKMAVFCSESMECLPGMSSRYFLRPLVTVPMATMTTGITEHFMVHIHHISMHRFLYFNFFSASLCVTFLSDGTDTSISVEILSLFIFDYYMLSIFQNLPICLYTIVPCYTFIFAYWLRYMQILVSGASILNSLHIE